MLSLVTINLNNDVGLVRAINFVCSHETIFSFEHIFIVGDSANHFLNIGSEFKNTADNLVLPSEKDSRIYKALEKEARLAAESTPALRGGKQ